MLGRIWTGTLAATIVIGLTWAAAPAGAVFPGEPNRTFLSRQYATISGPVHGGTQLDLATMKLNGDDFDRLTKTNAIEFPGHYSPDGTKVVYVKAATAGYQIWRANADGTHRQRLSTGNVDIQPTWTKSGKKIVFVRITAIKTSPIGRAAAGVPAPRGGGSAYLMVMNADGSDKHAILNQRVYTPVVSPSSGRIYYSRYDGDGYEIFSIKPSGLDEQQHTDFNAVTLVGDLSPDGERLVYLYQSGVASPADASPAGLVLDAWYMYNTPAANPSTKPLYVGSTNEYFCPPQVTANGERVVYCRRLEDESLEIYSRKLDGSGGQRRITNNAVDDMIAPLLFAG